MSEVLRSLMSCLGGTAVLLCASAVFAGEPKPYPECGVKPGESEVAAAKGAFQAGNASFAEADYPRAILYWEDAYRRDCTAHALLLNLARAYELADDRQQAIVALETYLARVPAAEDRDLIARRIEVMRNQLEQDTKAAAALPAATPAPAPAPVAPGPKAPPPESADSGGRSALPLVVAGVGGALAITGSIVYFKASSDVEKYDDLCPDRNCEDDAVQQEANDARSRVTLGGALAAGGGVLVVGGLIWYFATPSSPSSSSGLVPLVGPRGGGLVYSGRF